jgi:manganese-dependent inorganic pyrophosphatase
MESFGFFDIEKEVLLCIDHHTIQSNLKAKEIRFKKIGAACSMVAEMFIEKNLEFTNDLAKVCVIGIISDTMGLRNAKTSERDREIVKYLYKNYNIDISFRELVEKTVKQVMFRNMTIERILTNSLREYNNGRVGISQIFVLNEDYKKRISDILEEGKKMKYDLYIFALHIQKENRSVVYYFDRKYNIFPVYEEYDRVISRSRDLLPHVLTQIKLRST